MGALNFVYDYSDQPTSISGSASGTYTYDGNLKRVKSVINGKTIYNVHDAGGSLVHIDERPFNGAPEKRTDYVTGPMGTLARITNNTETYLHPDHLGSSNTGTNSVGQISWREQYSPFGERLSQIAANDNLDGFTGHVFDKATGLNYMQARYYDPLIGRFLSIDPVGFEDTGEPVHFNRYAYANNNPINVIDPDGKCGIVLVGGNPCAYLSSSDRRASIDATASATVTAAEGYYDFFVADGVATVQSAAQGDLKGAAAAATLAVVKPAKVLDKANDIRKAIPKPPRGKGSVPKDQRDPQRAFSNNQQQEMIDRQGGKCANGCGKDIDLSNSQGHHVQRHADGGPTTLDNGVQPCTDCHKKIHSPD